ncbi:MAG: PEP-CTERM sorting domain-containing protein [Rhodocyclaceae bacterium]|nr:PEP-CTERM sorting domain-containing protein [Rhodocyclaceae bacterium]
MGAGECPKTWGIIDGLEYRVEPIPEPETWTMLAAGLGLLALRRAR